MADIGQFNTLRVTKLVDFGLYVDGGELGEILLPARYAPPTCRVGDALELFIYCDSEDRLIATTETPRACVGEFALLPVVDINATGAFLDWGLPKQLLVPFAEQKPRMELGKQYIVRLFVDDANRIVASSRLDDFLYREAEGELAVGDPVLMLIANRSELGYQVIIDHTYWGLLHHHEVPTPLRRGATLDGFIKRIRDDGRIDLCLHRHTADKISATAQLILQRLQQQGGFIAVTDNSAPEIIRQQFGISKKMYKQAVGSLYKAKRITLDADGIALCESEERR